MPAVGINLPPHLTKRKRSPTDPEDPESPPHKLQAATAPSEGVLGHPAPPKNPEELQLDNDTSGDDEYGPSKPASKPSPPAKRILGPALPPTAAAKRVDELDLEESSEDEYGPSKPAITTNNKPFAPPPKRILGPAPPPAPLSELPSHPANQTTHDDTSDSEDDYGPSLPSANDLKNTSSNTNSHPLFSSTDPTSTATPTTQKPQRESWMLIPPSALDSQHRVDPTKLKNRKFASGKGGASTSSSKTGGISAIWTETPEEKRRRVEDEVLGRKEAASSSRSENMSGRGREGREEDREEIETERRIREYNTQNRGKSLLEEFSAGKEGERGREKEKEDDPSKRGFDREKDMALGGRLGHGQKREMLAKAREFGGRFERGKYL